jgi:hypothetical protein
MKYEVIAVENFCEESGNTPLNPKDLYDLTFNLSFGFFNYQNSIKLPAPLMYAKTMVNQIKQVTTRKEIFEVPDASKDKMFFI